MQKIKQIKKQQMKQKYQVFECLQNYFTDTSPELQNIIVKKFGSKKPKYSLDDPITNIYFVLAGDIQIQFINRQGIIQQNNIVGEYQLYNQCNRRTTTLRACTKSQIAILPISYFHKIKPSKFTHYKFISTHLDTKNHKLRYIFSKCFQHQYKFREDKIILENQNLDLSQGSDEGNHFAMIKSGTFIMNKYIGIGVVQKQKYLGGEKFELAQVGEGQIINQNVTCDSPKGEIFILKIIMSSL